ncbi:polysaccharide lyase family 1 protein [Erythrobacter sp. GH1-10]|uniref:polysaccharide lyase family 1 protein n=1 Tax=Erythrobacter sp. GH1-10 TaxID=3349334 RepID=UPI003877D17F
MEATDISSAPPHAAVFPAAIGYGASSRGGEGGAIIAVTNLRDSGPGSYRACVEASGPRVCVFRVDGVIRFTGRPPIIRQPYLTIAGQTAPGVGITLTHSGGNDGRTPLVIKNTHDVIVRHIRVRLDRDGGDRRAEDAITIENSRNVIIDHVSASGARDEIINGHGNNDNITISHSIFSYGVPRHDKCALLASDPVDPVNLSFVGNVCAHNGDRNPDANFPPGSCVEVINNQFYNAQSEFAEVWEGEGGTPISIVGNSFIAGPDTRPSSVGIENDHRGSTGRAKIFAAENRFVGEFTRISANAIEVLTDAPPCKLTLAPIAATTASEIVLKGAGAYPRDAIDRQVVDEIRTRSGRIGYLPRNFAQSSGAKAYPDRDQDGMDDDWERQSGADPNRADSWEIPDGDGISRFEAFLAFREKELQR